MTTKELRKLKTIFLNRQLKKELVERSGETRRSVNKVLNGEYYTPIVINTALKILEERATELEKSKTLINANTATK